MKTNLNRWLWVVEMMMLKEEEEMLMNIDSYQKVKIQKWVTTRLTKITWNCKTKTNRQMLMSQKTPTLKIQCHPLTRPKLKFKSNLVKSFKKSKTTLNKKRCNRRVPKLVLKQPLK